MTSDYNGYFMVNATRVGILSIVIAMWRLVLCLCPLLIIGQETTALPHGGKIWALLVAGSNEYNNYRHQADICRAYQILHANGIPDENIIVMMYDDIAFNEKNPTPGIIVNEPGGSDVYTGVPKDYIGRDVNASVFLAVLRGDKAAMNGTGSGRVIESGPYDHVFVNFVDHGAPGLLAMPYDLVYASQLQSTLLEMAAASRFAKLLLYIEACESGSMFDSLLPDDSNILAVTAADPHESSYACYFDNDRKTYLGDLFSVMWMQETEQEDLTRTTIHHQFEIVRTRTNLSHVEEYGDLNMGSMLLRDFIGYGPATTTSATTRPYTRRHPGEDVVSSRNVELDILQKQLARETDIKKQKQLRHKLHRLHKKRAGIERIFKAIVHRVVESSIKAQIVYSTRKQISSFVCYETAVRAFDTKCATLAKNTHAFSRLYLLVNLCEDGYDIKKILHAINTECPENKSSENSAIS